MSVQQQLKDRLGPEYRKPQVVVWFEDYTRRDHDRTNANGRPCYKAAIAYREKNPKDRFTEVCRQATEDDFKAWPEEYARYKAIHAIRQRPRVDFLPEIDVATVREMNAVEIYNIDDLMQSDIPEWEEWRVIARKIAAAIDSPEPVKQATPQYTGFADFSMEMTL